MKKAPWKNKLHLFLILQFLWSQVYFSCSAFAQNIAEPSESQAPSVTQGSRELWHCIQEGTLGMALGCMRQSFSWVAANPTLPVAIRTLTASRDLIQKHPPLNAMALALQGRSGPLESVSQCLAGHDACINDPLASGCLNAKAACEQLAMGKYIQTKHNALINALATANNVAEITNNMGNEQFKEAVLAATLDVIPRNVTGPFVAPLPTEVSAVDPNNRAVVTSGNNPFAPHADIPAESLVRSVVEYQKNQSRQIPADTLAFKQAIILENVKSLLRNYWMFQGLYQRAMPRDNSVALIEVFGSSNNFNRYDLRELHQVLDETRAYLLANEQVNHRSRTQNQTTLLAQLNESRGRLEVEAAKLRKMARGGEVLSELREMIQSPGVTPPSEHYSAEQRAWIQSVSRPLSVLLGGSPAGRCYDDGRVEVTSDIRQAVRSTFARMAPGHESELVIIFESYLGRYRPQRSVPPLLSDQCGFNRRDFILSFFDTVFQVSFGMNRADLNNEYLDQKMNEAKVREITQNPLLYTEALRASYDVLGNTVPSTPITMQQLRAAFAEQANGMSANLNELTGYLSVPAGQERSTVAKLILMNPRAAWRVVARDWTFLGQLSHGYRAAEDARLQREARDHILFWASVGLGAAALITGGASLLASTPATAAILAGVSTGIGLAAGTLSIYNSTSHAIQTHKEYQFARNAVIAGLQSNAAEVQRAEQLFVQYEGYVTEAILSGALTVIDIILMTRAIRSIAQLIEKTRVISSLSRVGVAGEFINVSEEELTRLGGQALVRQNTDAAAIHRVAGNHPELSGEELLQLYLENPGQLTSRLGRPQADEFIEAVGIMARRHSRSVGDLLRRSIDNGMTLDQLASDVLQGLKRSGPSAVSNYPGWTARLKNFVGSGQSYGRPVINSVDDANRFATVLVESLYRRSIRPPTVAGAFRKSFVKIFTERDWNNANPIKIFFDDVAIHSQRNPMDLVDVMISENLSPTSSFLADAFSPGSRAGMGAQTSTGRISQGFWENIAQMSTNPTRMRNAIGGLRLVSAGLSFAFMDLAAADDLYGLAFEQYLEDKVLCTNESVGNGRQAVVPSQAQIDLATHQEMQMQQCRRLENELPRLRQSIRACQANMGECRIGGVVATPALVERNATLIAKFEYDLATCQQSNFMQQYIANLSSIRATHCLEPAVY